MKIAFVSQPFDDSVPPIESGSIQIWTYQVILHLAKEHDITVYAVRKPGNGAFQEEGGIKYRRMSLFWDRWILRFMRLIKFWYRDPRKPHHASVLYYIGYMIQTALDIRRRGYDVVHIHNYSQFVLPIRFFNPRVKIVLHMQGEWLSQLDHGMIRHRLSKVQQILGCSDYLMDKVVDVIPEVKAKVRTLYNGVDTTKFVANGKYDHAEEDQIVRFLFVGRHSPEKGVHDLLRAMQLLRERTDRFHLTVVGPKYVVPSDMIVDISSDPKVRDLRRFYGEDPNNQETYLKALEDLRADGLEDFVTFAGSIPHSQLAELYRDC
ncbi:MAG TPA: glycosyltransferase family 4 protein, partial [Calditrichia bacterium]|nr:glycosyltransferase family 4 protein [Calditrichia bacterium]